MTQINLAKNLGGLRQHGGLWRSAKHLIHPSDATLDGGQFYNSTSVIRKNFASLGELSDIASISLSEHYTEEQIASMSPALKGILSRSAVGSSGRVSNILDYGGFGGPTPLVDAGGNAVDLRGGRIYVQDHCCTGLGVSNPKCTPEGFEPPAEPPAEPTYNDGCCGPLLDCPECEPCEDAAPYPTGREKLGNLCTCYSDLCVGVIHAGYDFSTFQFMGDQFDPWDVAADQLIRNRSRSVEHMLVNGSGQVDQYGQPTYGLLGGGNVVQAGSVGVIQGGKAVHPCYGIALLEEALAACLGEEAGMIHAPPSATQVCCECLYHDTVDYDDGMGEREVTRTKTRGNIVVSGGGYTGAMGPDGCPCEPGEAWMYGTSIVNLVYGHPMFVPDRQPITFAPDGSVRLGGAAGSPVTNDVFVLAEQPIVPIISKCCRFAVKISLCP